ncbi:ImmA/IrrE family metallo-endopeptidase [Desulforamulus aquiferis]|uniref:ImmA/IrrE family metallo-endopeptidase n=1 Tax=Desulforamulus aquiferis TaxID=1397668 RepID=A0AAW7Z7X8_9FIRM|nr:ImmA/IrrE family metallo-endopeptidase [Desulforamulus aquiferis]MDO7785825.1 ImmA/IrrE family metallo-endopeptidase [Desulforamulus aquiferis]
MLRFVKFLFTITHSWIPNRTVCTEKKAGQTYIILNTKLLSDPTLHLCTLAEEIGHHITRARSNLLECSAGDIEQIAEDEYKAKKWAVNFLVPKKEFQYLTESKRLTDEDLAKHFNVTLEFIKLRRMARWVN